MSDPDRHKVESFKDMVEIYMSLPNERREVFKHEMGEAIQTVADITQVVRMMGGSIEIEPITWVNDTKGNATVCLKTEDGSLSQTTTFPIKEKSK